MVQRRNIVPRDADNYATYSSEPAEEIEEEDAGFLCNLFGSAFATPAFVSGRLEGKPLDRGAVLLEPHPFDVYLGKSKARAGSPERSAQSEPEWSDRIHWSTGEEQLSQDLKRIMESPMSLCKHDATQQGRRNKAEWSPQGRGSEYVDEVVNLRSEGMSRASAAFGRIESSDSEWTQVKEINLAFNKERQDIYGRQLQPVDSTKTMPPDDEISDESSLPFVLSDESETQERPMKSGDAVPHLPAEAYRRLNSGNLNTNHNRNNAWPMRQIPRQHGRPLEKIPSHLAWPRRQIPSQLAQPTQSNPSPQTRLVQQLPNPKLDCEILSPQAGRTQLLNPQLDCEIPSPQARHLQLLPNPKLDDEILSPRARPTRPICDSWTQTMPECQDSDRAQGCNQEDGLRVPQPQGKEMFFMRTSTQSPLPLRPASPPIFHAAHRDGQVQSWTQTPDAGPSSPTTKEMHSGTKRCGHNCIFRHTTIDGQEYHVWSPPNEEGYRAIPLKTINPLAECCRELAPTPEDSLAGQQPTSPHSSRYAATPRQELRAATRAMVDWCRPLADQREDGNVISNGSLRMQLENPVAGSEGREVLEVDHNSAQSPTMIDAEMDFQHDPSGVPSWFQPPGQTLTRSSFADNGYHWYTQPPVADTSTIPTQYVVAPEYQLPQVLLEPQHTNQWGPCYKCKNAAAGFQCHCTEREKRAKDWIKDRIFWQPKQRYPCARQAYDKERLLYLRHNHSAPKVGRNALL
eukprot:GEMP01015446.1.p1 GENE.GEMP01015446.1~~GEMP01015446.1.p1  ORF type:complete len:741 (+),score=163.40 GEMP01015446.1:54-2276(+)